MQTVETIDIANDFSHKLGARYIYEGDYSGQLFLERLLLPKFESAVNKNGLLLVYLDGVLGYPSSFISGSFGKLSIEKGKNLVLRHIVFSTNSALRMEKIVQEIENPRKK